ncbi:uncharacterized protein [Procambarus clarkii]|uniref:uncharacterized protein n=1 Tax=Procambarus clarkii TaxID=6728 RepID=UPI001E67285F|nr:endochitinase A-like [Procambarus clarkii]XP_045624839.1 endochitinase A-like [Procambarus clarkii]
MVLRRLWLAGVVAVLVATVARAQENTTASDAPAQVDDGKPKKTGDPQKDYLLDPNLPHELIGYDLSNYPFYNRLPKDLLDPKFNFTCDNRHDGFYASIPHKCQVYHNCLFGTRYDFLCANYTVFDQKNFICHYVSEVDCENSEKHYDRNDELYETTTTTTSTTPAPQIIYVERPRPIGGQGRIRANRPNRQRPFSGKRRTTTTTPSPDYDYDYYGDYYDDYYNDETTTTTKRPLRRRRPNRPRQGGQGGEDRSGGGVNARNRNSPRGQQSAPRNEEFSEPQVARLQQANTPREQTFDNAPEEALQDLPQDASTGNRRRRPNRPAPKVGPGRKKSATTTTTSTTTTTTTTEPSPDYYYDEYYDYGDENASTTTTTTTTTAAPGRRTRPTFSPSSSRNRPSGSSFRPRPNPATDTTAAEVTVDEPTEDGGRTPIRSNVNRQSAIANRRVSQAEPLDIVSDVSSPSERQRPQRVGPSFPKRRSQTATEEAEVATEAVNLEPDLEFFEDALPDETAADAGGVRDRNRVRLPGPGRHGNQRPRVRRHGQPSLSYDDY